MLNFFSSECFYVVVMIGMWPVVCQVPAAERINFTRGYVSPSGPLGSQVKTANARKKRYMLHTLPPAAVINELVCIAVRRHNPANDDIQKQQGKKQLHGLKYYLHGRSLLLL